MGWAGPGLTPHWWVSGLTFVFFQGHREEGGWGRASPEGQTLRLSSDSALGQLGGGPGSLLRCAQRRRVNIYTDFKHAFAPLHEHGVIYKERGLLTAGGTENKNKEEILQLLEAVWEPSQVAVLHYKGHQRGTNP